MEAAVPAAALNRRGAERAVADAVAVIIGVDARRAKGRAVCKERRVVARRARLRRGAPPPLPRFAVAPAPSNLAALCARDAVLAHDLRGERERERERGREREREGEGEGEVEVEEG